MSSPSTTEVCYNSNCREPSGQWKRGWRRRTGDYANLCDRCASVYEGGRFCETFHLTASGWRCCESCGKQIHCGCIVSFHMFVLLDAGGIECLTCARRSYILTPNPAWPPPLHFLPSQPERMKDLSMKTWNSIAGSGPVPWRQAPSLFNGSEIQSNVPLRMPFGINISGIASRQCVYDRLSTASPELKQEHSYERMGNENLRFGHSGTLPNGKTELFFKEPPCPFVTDIKPVFTETDYASSTMNMDLASSSKIDINECKHVAFDTTDPPRILIPEGKQRYWHSGMGSFGEPPICSVKARGDGQGRNQLFPRYHPQITVKELQQISGVSKSVITPLFEKMLSASDAGRIGRLVLPKKCAEAYFPQILQPEGLPVKVQDVKGKEWVFQFRFWPNNHSRMYVLEGITPCIQSMQLQAGDIVTFSRLDPEGTLVMGGRKSLIPSSNQGDEVTIVGSDTSNLQDGSARNKYDDSISLNGHTQENILEDKPVIQSKRKNTRVAKGKRLRIVNEDAPDLKLTWKEAQGLMRPPAKVVPSIFVVEGCEFEEFEEVGPIIGRPTIYGIDHLGENIQWIQCEDCFKWRKVPSDALLPSRWICSLNMWDLDRSQCSSAEELTKEQLEYMLPTSNNDSSKKEETTERNPNLCVTLEGLDALSNLAIEGENNSSTKHPRHKPGCTCIVCLQPPSGKGSKHEQPCDCVVCSALKRRFKTLMERRERKQIEMAEKLHDLDDTNGEDSFSSHVKGQIDLNVQPEEDGLSTGSESDGPSKCTSENLFRQQDGIGGVSFISCLALDGDQ